MFRYRVMAVRALVLLPALVVCTWSGANGQPQDAKNPHPKQGSGIVIELDNAFIEKYMDRATMETDFRPVAFSAVHPAKNDGEIHVAGFADEAKLPTVAEVMNAAGGKAGEPAAKALRAAANDRATVHVIGAWRLWCEHPGTTNQLQGEPFDLPQPGAAPSNPDHVFEIHPVLSVKAGARVVDASDAIAPTPGFDPHDAQKAFQLGYENVPCKIVPLGNRTRIITKGVGFNFTDFQIRLLQDPVAINDGHLVLASVHDTDGELLVRRRRMVFIKGTDADEQVRALKAGGRLRVTGIPRISLKLVHWRVDHKDDPGYDESPLLWDLPYEMIIVSAGAAGADD